MQHGSTKIAIYIIAYAGLCQVITVITLALLTNEELLDINQDDLGAAARLVSGSDGDVRVYERDLADGGLAVAFFNASDEAAEISYTATTRMWGRDVLAQADLDDDAQIRAVVPAHGTRIFRLLRLLQNPPLRSA